MHVVNGCFPCTGVHALLVAKLACCLGNPSACLGRVPSAARQKQANSQKQKRLIAAAEHFCSRNRTLVTRTQNPHKLSRRLLRSLEGTHSKGNCIHSQGTNEFPGDCWNSENITDVDGTGFQ